MKHIPSNPILPSMLLALMFANVTPPVLAVPFTPDAFFGVLQATYCPHDRVYEITMLEPRDAVGPLQRRGEAYKVLYNFPIQIVGARGTYSGSRESEGFTVLGNTFRLNPNLLSQTGGPGRYFISITYDKNTIEYDPSVPGGERVVNSVQITLQFPFDVLASPVSFHFRDTNHVDASVLCSNDPVLELQASPAGGDFRVNGQLSGLSFVGTKVLLNPQIIGNTNVVTYTIGTGTCATLEAELTVLSIPQLSFSIREGCVGEDLGFNISIQPSTQSVDEYAWEFGDGPAQSPVLWPQVQPDKHAYRHVGYYTVKLNYNKSFRLRPDEFKTCVGAFESGLVVKEAPVIDFKWENVCNDQPTVFQGAIAGLNTANVKDILWDFDGNGYRAANPETEFQYPVAGDYPVKFKVTADNDCYSEKVKTVYKVHALSTASIPYTETFDAGANGWITEVSDASLAPSSWQWGMPVGFVLNGDASGVGKAWFTNASKVPNLHYALNEKSWVHSPCFDLSNMKSPVLGLNIRSLLQEQLDGVVIQLDSSNQPFNDPEWVTVGQTDQALGWYDHRGIPGNPGSQVLNQYGWSGNGDAVGWRTSAIPLENYLPVLPGNRRHVRFRVALGSQDSNLNLPRDGFSFDNFTLAERDRVVMLEWFTNISLDADNNLFNTFSLQGATAALRPGMTRLEYHLNAPTADPLNDKNPSVHHARAAYYGVTDALPQLVLDGGPIANPFQAPAQHEFDDHTLEFSKVTFGAISVQQRVDGAVDVVVPYTIHQHVSRHTMIRIVVAEKKVDVENHSYYYVVREMLPDAVGTAVVLQNTLPVSSQSSVVWTPDARRFDDAGALTLIAFVQDDDTRQIYQSTMYDNVRIRPVTITATETLEGAFKVYPNPADAGVIVQANEATVTFKLWDVMGREFPAAATAFAPNLYRIETATLPDGLYLLSTIAGKQTVVMKVVVKHAVR
ncbi:T9SS type A sorting domain-containing protein [Chryseolinea lacunae]|uniref:T9SS type A sorting domain-containing protein n=1 Tax=Chryseolinea lacunae TaxID=2801331 RepID=A0ABS1L3A2_9BACT|nr:T9SS type A sorting domain-containing protein [Chryseolinea lacunae]MBL0745918.1 T9SS type A sorting domain-containing protein [Chryseolinea lacunae]